ncbi:hypothetical protein M9H77_16194 [Catharanthus roseus]|uniref:Uncharacterized protein n=1 Tax=Catharanthus roseus TaxID=4058 RepID=A0ACC0AZX5_CATRO|nr:hypothetical protein M9H77_16194 [Catharanthus roseus]
MSNFLQTPWQIGNGISSNYEQLKLALATSTSNPCLRHPSKKNRRMSLQKFLQSLRTVKRFHLPNPSLNPKAKIAETIISTILITSTWQPIPTTTTTLLSNLTPNLVHLILSDPHVKTPKCIDFFYFLVKNQSLLSFKLNLDTHLTLLCRLVKSRNLVDAENLLAALLIHENVRCPFSAVASFFENNSVKPFISVKVFNLMLKVYSDNQEFEKAAEAFGYMRNNGIEINERTCTIYLINLMRSDQLELGLEFFYQMLESDIEVSVFSLTVVVDGLCKSGEIDRATELVEEMVAKGIKPNIVTYNTLVDACAKRWSFNELDKILILMRKQGVDFSVETYRFLIDGFSSYGKIEDSEKMVFEMLDKGFKVETYTYNLIINGYCRLGNIERAFSLFCTMVEREVYPNVDTYSTLVSSFCKSGQMETVNELLEEMQSARIELTHGVFDTLIDAYCQQRMIDEAFCFLILMQKRGFIADFSIYEMVINGLYESDQHEELNLLLSNLVKRGMVIEVSKFIASIESSTRQKDQRAVENSDFGDKEIEMSSTSDLIESIGPILEAKDSPEGLTCLLARYHF